MSSESLQYQNAFGIQEAKFAEKLNFLQISDVVQVQINAEF